jgi:hypothetical protein
MYALEYAWDVFLEQWIKFNNKKQKKHHKQQRVCCLSPEKKEKTIVSQEQMKTNQQDITHFSWNTCFHRNLPKRN